MTMSAMDPHVYFSVVGRKILTVIGNDIYVNGLYINDGNGTEWQREGWKNNAINGIEVDPTSGGKIIYTACNNGVMRSTDSGKNWKILTNWDVTEVLGVALDPFDNKIIYAATAFGVWKSSNSGVTWEKKNIGLKQVNQTYVSSIKISRKNALYIGTADGVLASSDGGNTWKLKGLEGKEIQAMEIAPYDENIIACVTEDHGIYLSKDGGQSWNQISFGLKSLTFYTVAFDPQNKGVMYCGGYKTGIYKTINYGEKWIQLQNDITDKDVKVIAVSDENPDIVYAGLWNYGLYKSINGGKDFVLSSEPDGRIGALLIR